MLIQIFGLVYFCNGLINVIYEGSGVVMDCVGNVAVDTLRLSSELGIGHPQGLIGLLINSLKADCTKGFIHHHVASLLSFHFLFQIFKRFRSMALISICFRLLLPVTLYSLIHWCLRVDEGKIHVLLPSINRSILKWVCILQHLMIRFVRLDRLGLLAHR